MAGLQAQQICTLARQTAKCPGYQSQSGQLLNAILQELCQTYDLDLAKGHLNFQFNPALISTSNPNVIAGSGPYAMPADYLRANYGDVQWYLLGVPYPMTPLDLYEYNHLVQQSGLTAYPYFFTVDMSLSPPGMYIWPMPSGAFPVWGSYQRQMPDIATPETSATVPWFPNSNYLHTRVAGELMKLTSDSRASAFIGDVDPGKDTAGSASSILRGYLKLKDDNDNRAKRVKLDNRRFGRPFPALPNTKTVGW